MQVLVVFVRFFVLGLISFGGPAAHIGYFQKEFVDRLKWISVDHYGKLVALSQFLPGPGSSQVGFAIGLERAGLLGGVAAFIGFTLPSFLLMFLLATLGQHFLGMPFYSGVIAGLKLLAVIVVADAVLTMYGAFCKRRLHQCIAFGTAIILLCLPGIEWQVLVLLLAAIMGSIEAHRCNSDKKSPETNDNDSELIRSNTHTVTTKIAMVIFVAGWFGVLFAPEVHSFFTLFADFFRAGSLVFGGGHVVLPLLQETVGDALTPDQFLSGYAAAQAVPGPMFSLATYLGVQLLPSSPLTGALIATLGIFLPGFLLVLVLQNYWLWLSRQPLIAGSVAAINAAVVGLLLTALYDPVFVSAVTSRLDFAAIILGLVLLRLFKFHIVWLVAVALTYGGVTQIAFV
ncbi:MAG: chromate efflux transporter [Pseudomonadales bacterium]|nr:chromate efflux transporter [Pseudomonadales bacterium]